jgi:hypothetical protein
VKAHANAHPCFYDPNGSPPPDGVDIRTELPTDNLSSSASSFPIRILVEETSAMPLIRCFLILYIPPASSIETPLNKTDLDRSPLNINADPSTTGETAVKSPPELS